MSVVDEMKLDGLLGHKVVDETLSDCSIFMSMDGGGIIFETVAEMDNPNSLSSDKKAMIEESAHKVCQKHLMVIRKMQEIVDRPCLLVNKLNVRKNQMRRKCEKSERTTLEKF